MSQENVEAVRRGFEQFWDHGNIWHLLDPDIVWRTRQDMPDTATYRGIGAVKSLISAWIDAFERVEVDVLDAVDIEDQVVVSLRWRAWFQGSEDPLDLPEAQVWHVRDGRAVEVREFPSWAEALEAVGLSE